MLLPVGLFLPALCFAFGVSLDVGAGSSIERAFFEGDVRFR
jgi:membrane protein